LRLDERSKCDYSDVDSHGVRRECKSSAGGAGRAEIRYDSVNPRDRHGRRRTTGWLVFGAVIILRTDSVLPAGVAFAVGVVALAT
jgi:hypothetical protein